MKKLALALVIILGIVVGASAQNRGLFNRGPEKYASNDSYSRNSSSFISLPVAHGTNQDQEATPLGSGALLLIGFGAAYALKKCKKK